MFEILSKLRARIALSLGVALFASLLVGAAGTRAYAADSEDDPEVVAQAKVHYKAGLDAYKAGKYDVAIRELKKAYLLKRLPPLLLNIGATYRKMGDLDLSLHFYQKFLDEAPSDAKDRPEVEKIIGEIKTQKQTAPVDDSNTKAPEDVPPPKKSTGSEWNHNIIDAAPPETPIDVRVSTPVMKGVKVFVYYRSAGQADFNSVLMKRRGREKVGRIPGDAVTGRSLQYYIEAKDPAGTVVKSAGSSSNPNIIMVEEGVKPVMIASASRRQDDEGGEEQSGDEEEKPRKKKKPQRDLDEEEAPTTGSVNLSDDEPTPVKKRKASTGGLNGLQIGGIVGLSLGVGFAVVGGTMLGLAKNTADTLSADSKNPLDSNNNPIYFNNDPNAGSAQEADLDKRGKIYNGVGIAGAALGGIGIVAGASCLIADAVMKSESAHPKKKHKKKRRRVVEEDEEEETRNWYVAPVTGPTVVGVSGGFSF